MDKIKIDFNNITQDNFLGCNAVYHYYSFCYEMDDREPTLEENLKEIERLKKMRFSIARTIFELDPKLDFDSKKYRAFMNWGKALKEANIKVGITLGWDLWGTLMDFKNEFPNRDYVAEYARIGALTLKGFLDRGLDNLKYVFMMTEVDTHQPSDVPRGFARIEWARCTYLLHKELVRLNLRDKFLLIGPDEGFPNDMIKFVGELKDCPVDFYSSHCYAANFRHDRDTYPEWNMVMNEARGIVPKDKGYIFDEYGQVEWDPNFSNISEDFRFNNPLQGMVLVSNSIAALNNGVNSTFMWTLCDQQFPNFHGTCGDGFYDGEHRHGVFPNIHKSLVPYPSYYAYSLLSKYLGGEGSKIFKTETTGNDDMAVNNTGLNHYCFVFDYAKFDEYKKYVSGGVRASAVKTERGEYSIIVMNKGDNEREFEFNTPDGVAKLNRHIYVAKDIKPDERAEIIGIDKVFDCKGKLTDKLPANSFAIYTTDKD